MKKEILIGFLIGIFATFCGFMIYTEFISKFGFDETIKLIIEGKLYGKVLTLSVLPNLLVFFLFIKKRKDYRARGVLIATFFIAFVTLVLKFI